MSTYTIRRRLISIGRDYVVEDDNGQQVLVVDGKVRFARTFSVKNPSGTVLHVREKQLCIEPTYIIKRDGVEAAVVRRTSVMDASVDHFTIELNSGDRAEGRGKLWHDEGVTISKGDSLLAIVRRPQGLFRETFTLSITADVELPLLVAIAMSIVETDMWRGELKT